MTIDYKALAERIEAIAKRQIDGARLSAAQENDEQAKRFEERAADLRTVVSLLEGMAGEKPVAWLHRLHFPDGTSDAVLSFSEDVPDDFGERELAAESYPLHLHPAPQLSDTGFTLDQLAEACMWAEIPDSKYESLCIALAEERKAAPQPQREPTEAQIELPDYLRLQIAGTAAAHDVLVERRRQIKEKNWTPEHDDEHVLGEIAALAAFYAVPDGVRDWDFSSTGYGDTLAEALLPNGWTANAGEDRRRDLIKAGALILAEIERLDRAALAAKEPK